MASVIVPRTARSRRKVRPQLIRLDADLKEMIGEYIGYVFGTTGKRYTPGKFAQKVTYDQLSGDGDATFAVRRALMSKIVKQHPPKMPSWPLYFRGFEYDIRETILDWAKFSGANGAPMTTGEVVCGMTFMQIDDDEHFRAWQLARKAVALNVQPQEANT